MDIFADNHGSPCIDCGFCGRVHFTHEDEDINKLREKAKKKPEKYLESSDDSIAWGSLDGRQYPWRCPCDSGHKYEEFIWRHREPIMKYLKARATEELKLAELNRKICDA
jgi:hypothetical protein